jgi:hypothetical protein
MAPNKYPYPTQEQIQGALAHLAALEAEAEKSRRAASRGDFTSYWLQDSVLEQQALQRLYRLKGPAPGCECISCREKRIYLLDEQQKITSEALLRDPVHSSLAAVDALVPVPATQSYQPDYDRGDVVTIDKPKRGGDVDPATGRQVILPEDPNHGREGPVWKPAASPDDSCEVWFEDGIQKYLEKDLSGTGNYVEPDEMDKLPEIRPKGVIRSSVESVTERTYNHPYHVYTKNQQRKSH